MRREEKQLDLNITEKITLSLLDEETGGFRIRKQAAHMVLAGAAMIDLQMAGRVKANRDKFTVDDSAPLGDDILDPVLEDLTEIEKRDEGMLFIMLRDIALERGDFIFKKAVARLKEKKAIEAKKEIFEEMKTDILETLDSEHPSRMGIALISLTSDCEIIMNIISEREMRERKDRINFISSQRPVGWAVGQIIKVSELLLKPHKEIPVVKGLPVIGNAVEMLREYTSFFVNQYEKFGSIFRVNLVGKRSLVVLAGEDANYFMQNHGHNHLSPRERWAGVFREMKAQKECFLFGMDGPDHLRLRRAQLNGFSRTTVSKNINRVVDVVRRKMEQWPVDKPFHARHEMQKIITEQISLLTTDTTMGDYLEDVIYYMSTLLTIDITDRSPRIIKRFPKFKRARERSHEFFNKVLETHKLRRAKHEENILDEDYLHHDTPKPEDADGHKVNIIDDMLALNEEDPTFLPESDLLINVMLPFGAGLDTAARQCTSLMYMILSQPDLMEKVRAEADDLFADGMPTAQKLREMNVLRRVMMETLRMHTTVPGVVRAVQNSFDFNGYHVSVGEEVFLALSATHRLPEHFPDPDRFDIDRYTPERAEHKQMAYAPFGVGTHKCLGSGFAELQMALTVSTILHENLIEMHPQNYKLNMETRPFLSPDRNFRFKTAGKR